MIHGFKAAALFYRPLAAWCEAVAHGLACLIAATDECDLDAVSACLALLPHEGPPPKMYSLHLFPEESSPTLTYLRDRSRSWRSGRVRPRPNETRVSYSVCSFCSYSGADRLMSCFI